jgi:hypothetical protein
MQAQDDRGTKEAPSCQLHIRAQARRHCLFMNPLAQHIDGQQGCRGNNGIPGHPDGTRAASKHKAGPHKHTAGPHKHTAGPHKHKAGPHKHKRTPNFETRWTASAMLSALPSGDSHLGGSLLNLGARTRFAPPFAAGAFKSLSSFPSPLASSSLATGSTPSPCWFGSSDSAWRAPGSKAPVAP